MKIFIIIILYTFVFTIACDSVGVERNEIKIEFMPQMLNSRLYVKRSFVPGKEFIEIYYSTGRQNDFKHSFDSIHGIVKIQSSSNFYIIENEVKKVKSVIIDTTIYIKPDSFNVFGYGYAYYNEGDSLRLFLADPQNNYYRNISEGTQNVPPKSTSKCTRFLP